MSLWALGLALAALAGCGGSDSDPHADAVAAANDKEAEARAVAAVSPCATVAQCGVLKFQSPTSTCANWSYKPYSLVSPTAAAASAAAAEQNALARNALALGPASDTACPAVVPREPVLSCTANTCSGA
jgi:hypothetical protein